MTKKIRKIIVRIALILLIPIAGFAHFIIFPQETRSILINFSNFKKDGRVYFNASASKRNVDSLICLIATASIRIDSFWGEKKSNPKFIYCDNEPDFKKYAVNAAAPAVTYVKLGATIVLSVHALDADIIAHELSHAELYERIGFFKFNYKVPSWFRHGLAMQNDYRDYYSDSALKVASHNFTEMPDIKRCETDAQFYAGTLDQVMLNYMTAKHEIKNWYSKAKLTRFIEDLNSGKSFEKSFGQ